MHVTAVLLLYLYIVTNPLSALLKQQSLTAVVYVTGHLHRWYNREKQSEHRGWSRREDSAVGINFKGNWQGE